MTLLSSLARSSINPNRGLKFRINQIVAILTGAQSPTASQTDSSGNVTVFAVQQDVRDTVFAMLSQLPTANPGVGGFWLNSGVVTKGS